MNRPSGSAWDAAIDTIRRLRANGHVALLAGGCVRDMLLGQTPKDYDVATDATPQRVDELFPRSRMVGAKFGVVLVRRRRHDIEVATFRSDGVYSDGRRPDDVRFGTDLEDAKRRDFTINGLFYDPIDDRVIDHVGGQADLNRRVLRTIGDPEQRFAEDHLRMLRAVRFAARLGFPIDPATTASIVRLADKLRLISAERIWSEFAQIITAPTRDVGWALLVETGLVQWLAPTWRVRDDAVSGIGRRLAALPPTTIGAPLALAALLVGDNGETVRSICKGLRLSNRDADAVVWLLTMLPVVADADRLEQADLKLAMLNDRWSDLLELLRATRVAANERTDPYDALVRRSAAVDPATLSPVPLLDGDELLGMGMSPGPALGRVFDAVYRAQLNETIASKADAVALAQECMAAENAS